MTDGAAATLRRYYRALRVNDLQAWWDTFAAGAWVASPAAADLLSGPAALRALWESLTGAFEVWDVHEERVVMVRQAAAVTWAGEVVCWTGRAAYVQGVDVFDLDRSGRIDALRSFWDPDLLREALRLPEGWQPGCSPVVTDPPWV